MYISFQYYNGFESLKTLKIVSLRISKKLNFTHILFLKLQNKMGTRGYYCFVFKGVYYVVYSPFDSYPERLGNKLVKTINKAVESSEDSDIIQTILSSVSGEKVCISQEKMFFDEELCEEWVYTVDFDEEVFQVEYDGQTFEFDLDDISEDWIEFIKAETNEEEY